MRLRPLAPALALCLVALPALAADRTPPAAHRALYELKLETVRGGDVSAATGTMAFEVEDACEAWASRQRLTLNITNRDGQDIEMVSDYATLESKDGLTMRFRMRQTTETAVTDQVEGEASFPAPGEAGSIHYTVPEEKTVEMPKGTVFPMAHTEMILAAAAAGRKFVSIPIFDGTGKTGTQDSAIAIIAWQPPGSAQPGTDTAKPALDPLPSGRVRIAFYDRTPSQSKDKVAGSPDYEVGMRYWANGVADDLHMDFSDFVMQGRLKEFSLLKPHC